jgi:NADPH-dependent curcumin reductase CurA
VRNSFWVKLEIFEVDQLVFFAFYSLQDPPLPSGLCETHYLGALGLPGLTAYFGLVKVARAKQGERVVVSGAAGETGSMVIQVAKKMVGASHVVGIAGSEKKCRLVERLCKLSYRVS